MLGIVFCGNYWIRSVFRKALNTWLNEKNASILLEINGPASKIKVKHLRKYFLAWVCNPYTDGLTVVVSFKMS